MLQLRVNKNLSYVSSEYYCCLFGLQRAAVCILFSCFFLNRGTLCIALKHLYLTFPQKCSQQLKQESQYLIQQSENLKRKKNQANIFFKMESDQQHSRKFHEKQCTLGICLIEAIMPLQKEQSSGELLPQNKNLQLPNLSNQTICIMVSDHQSKQGGS